MTIKPELEFQADELSLKLLRAAGYSPISALKALRLLHRQIRDEVSSDENKILDEREKNLAELIAG